MSCELDELDELDDELGGDEIADPPSTFGEGGGAGDTAAADNEAIGGTLTDEGSRLI